MAGREIAVQAVCFPHRQGTVLYACSPTGQETIAGPGSDRAEEKIRLVSILRKHLAGLEGSPGMGGRCSDRADWPTQVVHDPLGRPRLRPADCEGPAISFSEGGGKIWAALGGNASEIGIDAAGTDEFPDDYPFQRAFQDQEVRRALRLTRGDLKKASALLWSIKEAVVKALGCAFHLVDPRQIRVDPWAAEEDDGGIFRVSLSGKALDRFPLTASRGIRVRSFFQENMWLSLALLNRQRRRTEEICSPDGDPGQGLDSDGIESAP